MVDICYSRCLVGFTRCMLGYRRQLDSLEQLKTTWIHVLQNELMQLLLIVQAMFVQQLHTGQVLRSSNNTSMIWLLADSATTLVWFEDLQIQQPFKSPEAESRILRRRVTSGTSPKERRSHENRVWSHELQIEESRARAQLDEEKYSRKKRQPCEAHMQQHYLLMQVWQL